MILTTLGGEIIKKENNNNRKIKDKLNSFYLNKTKDLYKKISIIEVEKYFKKSNFFRDMVLKIDLTDDNFLKIKNSFLINFYKNKSANFLINTNEKQIKNKRNCNFEKIKVRYHEFIKIIKQGLQWEDLSIGFQCRIERNPKNVYNSEFWHHFTNIYVNDNAKGRSENCSGCTIINQKIL